nr:zinc finger protein on ecdysone puffs-like [Lepeophtheirus salmonis]
MKPGVSTSLKKKRNEKPQKNSTPRISVSNKITKHRIWTRHYTLNQSLTPINPIQYFNCHLCPRSYYDQKTLQNHFETSHPQYNFKEEESLIHRRRNKREFPCKSQKEKLLEKCYVCFKRFDPDKLFDHKVSAHIDPRFYRYKCAKCNCRYFTQKMYAEHLCKTEENL